MIVVASLLGLPLPLTAVQILYINLISDGLPALALAVDPPDHDIMTKKPRKSNEGLLNRSLVVLMIAGASWSVFVNTTLFIWSINSGRPIAEAMTMVFASLVLIQFVMTYNFRSGMLSFFYMLIGVHIVLKTSYKKAFIITLVEFCILALLIIIVNVKF